MKQIPLSRGLFTLVDDDMYEELNKHKWYAKHTNYNNYYACRGIGGAYNKKDIYMHRLIMSTPDGMDCDHIDKNKLHNCRVNLRNCSHKQNMGNVSKHKDGHSAYIGVSLIKSTGKWRARIHVDDKEVRLGHFDDEIEAAISYDKAAIIYRGEFASLNFPKKRNPAA